MLAILMVDTNIPVIISETLLEDIYLAIFFPDKQR